MSDPRTVVEIWDAVARDVAYAAHNYITALDFRDKGKMAAECLAVLKGEVREWRAAREAWYQDVNARHAPGEKSTALVYPAPQGGEDK